MLFFLVPGLAYGRAVGTIRSDRDVGAMTSDTMATMGSYVVLAFVAAQLVAYFAWSNLGLIVAVHGAGALKALGIDGIPLLVGFILVSATVNLLIGSASAKWAIMAPVFVPMLMLMGYAPETAQVAYRIGDSVTNVVTPLLPYFPIVISFARRYDPDAGMGTLVASMLPYSVAFLVAWLVLLVAWVGLGIPLGPGAPIAWSPD
jgi:aminobenzoyl-glutamate transport protein